MYDYSMPGLYFITICVLNDISVFGSIIKNEIILNDYGKIVKQCWQAIPKHFSQAKIDGFVIMPNHVHGIIEIILPCRDSRSAVPTRQNKKR